MEENIYQNLESSDVNPLTQSAAVPKTADTGSNASPAAAPEPAVMPANLKAITKNPKILILVILGAIILLLAVVALIASSIRSMSARRPSTKPEPTPTVANSGYSPTPDTGNDLVPTQYIDKFNQINKKINTSEDFLPPRIDQNIGTKGN